MKVIIVVVLVAAILLGAFLLLKPAGDPTVESFPTLSTDSGTNCGATTDSGNWGNRQLAFADNEPDSDTTSATASGTLSDNICDDWTGFGFSIASNSTILEVLLTFEYRVGSGTVFLNAALESGVTKCQPQAATNSPSLYTAITFDFTSCKQWSSADFDGSAPIVSMGAFPQVAVGNKPAIVYLDYVKLTVTYNGPPPTTGGSTVTTRPASAPTIPAFLALPILVSAALMISGAILAIPRIFRTVRLLGIALFVIGLIVFIVYVLPYLVTVNLAF